MKTLMMFFLFLICDVATLFIFAITPYITRKTESFGVSIPEEVHSYPEVKKIRRNYKNRTLIYGGIISAIALTAVLFQPTDLAVMLITGVTFINMFIMFGFYLVGHKQMKKLKAKENWMAGKAQSVVVDTGFRSKKIMASPLWFILYVVIILATAMLGIVFYDRIPNRLPMHWNINGVVDGWAQKSYKTILWGPCVQLFLSFIMIFSYWMIGKSKQVINPSSPEKSLEQNRIFRYRWSIFMIATGLAIVFMISITQLFSFRFLKNIWILFGVVIIILLGILAAVIILSITTGQGGSKLYIKQIKTGDKTENKLISRDEDKYWKLGLFYCNPDDQSLVVEKRFGVGWTINFARPVSWIIIVGFIVSMVAFSIGAILMSK